MNALAGFAVVLAGAAAHEPGCSETPQLWVELMDSSGLDEDAILGVRAEVETVYRSAGVAIRWLRESPAEAARHVARVYIMDGLPPSLRRRLQVFRDGGADVMAVGLGRQGQAAGDTVYVSRRVVHARAGNGEHAELPPRVLGRALGRVVAHELAHRFLQRKHTRRGVLKADMSQSDLVGDGSWARFTEPEAERLRAVAWIEGLNERCR